MPMEQKNMCEQIKKPEIIVFAGPNGSGKTTVTKLAKVIEPYINADEIKRTNYCSDLEAAQLAEKMREDCVAQNKSFTFETVLSTDRNLKLLQKAKKLIPELVKVCDVLHIYDNSTLPFRIFKKRKTEYFYWQNEDWSKGKIQQLTGITL